MSIEKIIEKLLNKNKTVIIPTIGRVFIKNTSTTFEGKSIVPGQSNLDFSKFDTTNDGQLIRAIAEEKQVSDIEAQTLLTQWLDTITTKNQKIIIPNFGNIKATNGDYNLEQSTGKSLFPTDFFGLNTLNINDNNKSGTNLYIKIEPKDKVQTPKEVESTIEEIKSDELPENLNLNGETTFTNTTNSIESEHIDKDPLLPITDEETNILNIESAGDKSLEEKNTFSDEIKSFFETVFDDKSTEKEETEEEEEEEEDEDEEEDNDTVQDIIDHTNNKENKDALISHNIEDYTDPTAIEETKEKEIPIAPIQEEIPPIIYPPKNNYDIDYLDFSTNKTKTNNWGKVATILLGFIGLAFLIPYLWASFNGNKFLGMEPLWGTSSNKTIAAVPKTIDTAKAIKVDSSTSKSIDTTKKDTVKLVNNNTNLASSTPTNGIKPASNTPTLATNTPKSTNKEENSTKSQSTKMAVTSKNTMPKDNNASNKTKTNLKNVALSTIPTAKENIKEAQPLQKKLANTTANYTKGNHYLSFGSFKIPANAKKLRTDLNKLGVVTDIVVVDGSFKVVIPYKTKENATNASKEYPNTTIFE